MTFWHLVNNDNVLSLKGGTAAVVALALLWTLWRPTRRALLVRDGVLGIAGALSFLLWFNLGHFHFDGYIHYYDQYHYYIGSKYFRELGYTRLYQCSIVAFGSYQGWPSERYATVKIRNLADNTLEPATRANLEAESCAERFSPERWRQFQRDVTFFRAHMSGGSWTDALRDHGYNATPVWGMVGGALASLGPATEGQILFLGALDAFLLTAMWGLVFWAFGWRTACVALVFWGCNYPARYWWNGGAFLRMDWLFATVAGVCLLKKERPLASGFMLGWGALLRIFPGFIAAALLLKIAVASVRARRLVMTASQRRFVAGGALAVALLVPLSAAATGGFSSWRGFVENSRKHLSTPLTNNMGLRTVLAWDARTRAARTRDLSAEDPFHVWKEARRETFQRHRALWALLAIAFVVVLGLALDSCDDVVALALGAGLIVVFAELTCYYYSFLLLFGLLWPKIRWSGVALSLLASLSCAVPFWLWWDDQRFTLISVASVALAFALTLGAWKQGTNDRRVEVN
jgi:hypothetical protein